MCTHTDHLLLGVSRILREDKGEALYADCEKHQQDWNPDDWAQPTETNLSVRAE